MRILRTVLPASLLALASTVAVPALAANTDGVPAESQPDNTGRNVRDTAKGASATAQDAGNGKINVERTRDIRKAIIADKTLSTYAHNVKIVAQGSSVLLKGPVRSEHEKATVEKLARDNAGGADVRSELEVSPP